VYVKGVHVDICATIYAIHTRKMHISLSDIYIRIIFLLSVSARLLRLFNAVNIRYPQIGNKPILDDFKNNFDRFLVFWACFENIMQHQKYVELRKKKKDDWYDLKIFI